MLSRSENGEYQVKLIDFGAVANPQVQGGGSTVAGTFGYMPPEQLMGKTVPGSDIYALAAVAVHIFSGKSPADLPSKDFRLIFEPSMEQMPPELLNTLRKMLEPKVDERLCDVDDIKHRFYKFRDNDYKINQKPSAITKDLDTMLKKVRYIGETGNMDVWQSLADETPRPIPKLLYYAESENEYIGFIERIPDMTEKIGAMPSILIGIVCFLLLLMLSKGLLIGVLFANIILAPILLVVALVARKLAKTAWFRILVFVSMMVLVSCFTSVETDYLMYSFFAFCMDVLAGIACFVLPCGTRESQIKELAYSSTINPDKYNELLCFGRKMIATIVDVKYEPAKNAYIRCKEYYGFQDDGYGYRTRKQYVYYDDPRFVIRYKFNPPDDDNDNDVIHQCVVHTEPENHYKPGDPLPILYLNACIHKNDYQVYGVYSMVFPFPHEDAIVQNLLCFTATPSRSKNNSQNTIHKKKANLCSDDVILNLSSNSTSDYYLQNYNSGKSAAEAAFDIFFGGNYEANKNHIIIDSNHEKDDQHTALKWSYDKPNSDTTL